jgi:outer membrane receptor protein involved in Fe transport
MLAGAPIAAALFTTPLAHAQERDAGVLENVIVTAQKRQEDLQDVPLSIQAIGTQKLEELGVADFDDYVKFLPSVSYQEAGPGFARVYMRGVVSGDNGNHSGSLPTVGMYLDEQPITTIQGPLDIHVYDVARVESLAGPQGTLYGASSQAGTIRIITNKPDTEKFSSAYNVEGNSVSGGDDGYLVEGYANFPLSDTAAIRLVGWKKKDAGYIDNVPVTRIYPSTGIESRDIGATNEDYNDIQTYGARAALRLDLNENWTMTPSVMGQNQESTGSFAYDPAIGEFKIAHAFPENSRDKWVQTALTIEGKISNLDFTYAGSVLQRSVDANLDYADYSYFYDVMYFEDGYAWGEYFTDNDGNFIDPGQYIRGKDRYDKMSHEFRIASPSDDKVSFVAGLFMQRQKHNIEQDYLIGEFNDVNEVTGWSDSLWLTKQDRVDRDYAAFGEVTVKATDKLSVTGGLRVFRARNSLEGFYGFGLDNPYGSSTGENSCTGEPPIGGAPCTNLDKTVEEEDFTYKGNVTYRFTDDILAYATISRGYRPGGVNRRGTFPPYKSDFLMNYELGWKTQWAGNRVRFNGAVFMEDWDDFQYSFLGENGLTNITNAGGAEILGLEAELEFAVTADLTIGGGIALLDPTLTGDFCQQLGPDGRQLPPDQCPADDFAPDGVDLPTTPKLKGNVTARYSFMLGPLDSHAQASYVYQGESRSALLPFDESVLGKQGSYSITDLSFGVGKDSWSVEAFVNNVFDERADLYRFVQCDTSICSKTYTVPNRPRTIGVRFGQQF